MWMVVCRSFHGFKLQPLLDLVAYRVLDNAAALTTIPDFVKWLSVLWPLAHFEGCASSSEYPITWLIESRKQQLLG
jgi:hypothetical protein